MNLTFYQHKKCFITGHTGFKGAWLCHLLLRAGAEITGYALAPLVPSLFLQTKLEKKMRSLVGDVRDLAGLTAAMQSAQPEIIFHLAAQPLVRESYREPVATFAVNVFGTVNLLEAARLTPSARSIVNVTTDKVYENREQSAGYREDENLGGYDPYAASKACSELVTQSYRRSFFAGTANADVAAISTARSGNVIGGGDYAANRIIPDCARAVGAGEKISVRHPDSIRPYQHVLECLAGYLTLAEKQYQDKSLVGAYNFGPDETGCVTTGEVVDLFCAAWGAGAEWTAQDDHGPHEANLLKLDCAKSRTMLGWAPRWNIETAVEKTVEFAKCGDDDARAACVARQVDEYFVSTTKEQKHEK